MEVSLQQVLFFAISGIYWPALALTAVGINNLLDYRWSEKRKEFPNLINYIDYSPVCNLVPVN